MTQSELIPFNEDYSTSKARSKKEVRKLISIRIEESHINATKRIADQLGVGYQTLMRAWIVDRLQHYTQE